VVEQSGAVIPNASVRAISADTGLIRAISADGQGRFLFPALPVGSYDVEASHAGFATRILRGVVLTLGATVEVELLLGIAGSQEHVTVVGEPPGIDPAKIGLISTISRRQVDGLPINGRNFVAFSLITPGVSTDRTPQQGATRTSGLTFAGQGARSNNIMVDGLDNNDETVGSVRATFSQEAVQEFQVLGGVYSAEFGKASGGVVNIITRSGTNELSGNIFAFARDARLNAKEHFEKFSPSGTPIDRPKAPYRQWQFGATAGGPLKRDRSFFFGSVERLDATANNFVGIDDSLTVRHPVSDESLGTAAEILRRAGFPVQTGHVPYALTSTQLLARVDHQATPNHGLTVRFTAADELNENIEPFGGTIARSRGARLKSADLMLAASYLAVLGSRSANELRFQVARRNQVVEALDPLCAGVCNRDDEGGPTLDVTGYAAVGRHRFTPTDRDNTRYQVLDTFSRAAGSHNVKAGVDFSYVHGRNQSLPLHFGGRYIFLQELPLPLVPGAPAIAVSSIQAVALGFPAAYVQGYGNPEGPYDYGDLSLFAQDEIRLRERLTLRVGVRYQRQFWPGTTFQVTGYPDAYTFPRDGNNVAPRIGVSWDPIGDRKTLVHSGYGVFFENIITSIAGVASVVRGGSGVRTLVLPAPRSFTAWAAPGRRLTEADAIALVGATYPSVQISIDPGLKTPYAHHWVAGVEREVAGRVVASANALYVRGFRHLGTIDYNPILPELGPGRRPADIGGVAGTSASVLQYTSYGETWYRGLTLAVRSRFDRGYQFLLTYTLSKAEDNSTDFQSAFLPQNNGRGRNPDDLRGLPIGFVPDDEKGPSLQDQRHRLVFSGVYVAPGNVTMSSIITIGSGRPYTILAGADLNMDGNGGAFPPDRARRDPADERTAVGRNSGTLPSHAVVDFRISRSFPLSGQSRIEPTFEVFNLFNRTNYTDIQNVFGRSAYPGESVVPSFGRFTQAGPPRQVQLGIKVHF
jgi:hypothetical protein